MLSVLTLVWSKIKTYLANSSSTGYTKYIVIALLVALILFGAGYATGRYFTPAKVIEHTKTVEVVKEVTKLDTQATTNVQVKDQEAKQVDTQKTNVIKAHIVTVTTKDPQGNVKITKTVDYGDLTSTKKDASDNGSVTTNTQNTQNTHLDHILTDTKTMDTSKITINNQPSWHVGLQGGLDLTQIIKGNPKLDLGVQVEHRFIGPVWLGAYGNKSGTAGITLSVEF